MVSWLSTVLAVVLVAVFYTDLPTYISVTYGTLVPYQWVLAFGVLALPLIIRHARTSQVLTSPVVGWCFLYLFVTILWFIPSAQSDIAWQEVRWRIMTVLSLMIFLILSGDAAFNRVIRTALVAAVLFGVALNVYEVFVPLSFSSVVGRSAGLYINPTTSGLALVGGMIIAVSVLPRRFRGLFVLLVGLGVVTTFARGGIIAWLLAAAGLLVTRQVGTGEMLRALMVGLLLLAVIVLPRTDELLTMIDRSGVINSDIQERLLWLTNPSEVQDQSSWARAYVARRVWERWAEQPFLGSGTGSAWAFEIGSHNQYLPFMVDHGVVGLLIFPLLIGAAIYRASGELNPLAVLFGCIQAFAGLVSHTLLNEPQTLLLFAVAATLPAADTSRRKSWEAMPKSRSRPQAAAVRAFAGR
jgi:hypothetical protein